MPFGAGSEYQRGVIEANFVYNKIILPAVESKLGKDKSIRATDKFETGNITNDIIRCIAEYEYAIVDITGLNPNVFYELGVRHSLRKNKTIVLKQEGGRAPFDIQGYRYIEYNPFQYELARSNLEATISSLIGNPFLTDSVVFDVLGDYDIIRKQDRKSDIVPWSFVYKTIDQIADRLSKAKEGLVANGHSYRPDMILGITNGGMLFAEILYRTMRDQKIYNQEDCIVHALWAERYPHPEFDCAVNEGMLNAFVQNVGKEPDDIRILLLDDNSGSGDTASFARRYINRLHPLVHVRYLPLFYKVGAVYDKIEDFLVWSHPAFSMSRREVDSIHFVEKAEFPYKKYIRDKVDIKKIED